MVRFFGYTIAVSHDARATAPPRRPRSRTVMRGLAVTAGAFAVTGGIAHAANPTPGPAVVNVNVATSFPIKSVTVTLPSGVSALTFDNCSQGSSTAHAVGFPNGTCETQKYTVTNSGNVSSEIDVQGAPMQPQDAGTPWQLCAGAGSPACNGTASSEPGVDQARNMIVFIPTTGPVVYTIIGSSNACDASLPCAGSGGAQPGASADELLQLIAPSSSTDKSPTFTATITYTAI